MALNDTREGRDIARLFDRHEESLQRLRAAMAAGAKRPAAGDYIPSQCPLGLHDNLYPGPDGECEDCELQGLA
jgi:hypothetical protein